MKNLDLATYGVEEMNEVQMQEVEGGLFATLFCIAVIALCAWFAHDDNPNTVATVNGDRVGN